MIEELNLTTMLRAAIGRVNASGVPEYIYPNSTEMGWWSVSVEQPAVDFLLVEKNGKTTIGQPGKVYGTPQKADFSLFNLLALLEYSWSQAQQAGKEIYVYGRWFQNDLGVWWMNDWEAGWWIPADDIYLRITPGGLVTMHDDGPGGNIL